MLINQNMIAYCGLYCPQCSFRPAHATGDPAHVEAIPERYSKAKNQPVSEYACGGCKQDDFCGPCAMRDCAAAQDFVSCADCASFPCDKTDTFAQDGVLHHANAFANLMRIREVGYEAWGQEMEAMLFCECGSRQSWYLPCSKHKV